MSKNLKKQKMKKEGVLSRCEENVVIEKKKKSRLKAEYTQTEDKSLLEIKPSSEMCKDLEGLPAEKQNELINEAFMKMMGTEQHDAAQYLLETALQALPKCSLKGSVANAVIQLIQNIAPKEPLEAMLCLQAVVLFVQGMNQLGKIDQSGQGAASSVRLLRLQQETTEKIERLRRKGQQSIVVQHVQVNDGGKAVVGNILPGGEGVEKEFQGGTPW